MAASDYVLNCRKYRDSQHRRLHTTQCAPAPHLPKHDVVRRRPRQQPRREEHVLVCAKNPVVPAVEHAAVSAALRPVQADPVDWMPAARLWRRRSAAVHQQTMLPLKTSCKLQMWQAERPAAFA